MLKWSLICAIAIVIPGLQVGLPWLSCYLASDPEDTDRKAMGLSDQRNFWTLRLSFDRFLHPTPGTNSIGTDLFSATVCRDEMIILQIPDRREGRTIDRINLRTGSITSSAAPAGIGKVISDGDNLWFLTDRNGAKEAFLYQGRVTRFQRRRIGPDDNARMTHELEWFEDEKWQPTGQFALIPFYHDFTFDTDLSTGELCCVLKDEEPWFQCGLKLHPRDEHLIELRRYLDIESTDVTKALQTAGWQPIPSLNEVGMLQWCWSEKRIFLALYPNLSHFGFDGLRLYRTTQDGQLSEQEFEWPVDQIHSVTADQIHLVRAHNGLYFVVRNSFDGRWTVYRWDSGDLVRLVDQRSPLLGITCLDVSLFVIFAFVIPTVVLSLAAVGIRRLFRAQHDVAPQIELASIGHRGIARTIDLLSWCAPLILSAVLHPQIIFWWYLAFEQGTDMWPKLWSSTISFFGTPSWDQLALVKLIVGLIAKLYLSIPLIRPLAVLALVVLMVQLLWQCWSGRTLGKWFMGIQVVRTDLRRCGWGRCLVREAFLLVDGFLFLTWVPGVICMLITSKSQRIGDLFPDTIVIRSARRVPIRSH
jgi:uncharacterized RDD family membrane protein YckC